MMKIRKVLITGGSGYLGSFVLQQLQTQYELAVFDLVPPEVDGVTFISGNITQLEEIQNACEGQDAIVHLVALVRGRNDKPLALFTDVMVKGTWNVAEACATSKVQRLINISSIVACGLPDRVPYRVHDPSHFVPSDLYYALAKNLGEHVCNAYHQAHGLSVIHLRPGVIAGDGHNPGPKAPKDTSHPWFNYVDPRDVAHAIALALSADVDQGIYNVVADRIDSSFDITTTCNEIGYQPQYNWPEIKMGDDT